MRKLLIALLLLASPAFAQTGTPKDKATLQSEINTNFPDNTTGLITPSIARTTFSDMLASWQQYAKVRAVTGTTDTILATDYGTLVTYSNAMAIAVTLPQATGVSFGVFNVMASNLGAGTVTITPTTSTINGASTLALTTGQGVFIYSDGANYQIMRTAGTNAAGTVTSVASGTGLTGGPITTTGTLALAAIAADNLLLNATGGSAAPTAQAVPTCSATASALTYNTSTHAFGCLTDNARLSVADQTLSGGANVTSASLGTITMGTTTIDCGTSPLQFLTDGGAFTLAAPSNDGSCMVLSTNNGSAGAITFSGFTVGSNTGAALDTTNGHKFTISIWRINGTSGYTVFAHQ